MAIRLHWHALLRMHQRGASEHEVLETVAGGNVATAQKGRVGFRRTFRTPCTWRGRHYRAKQVIAYAVPESDGWLVITVVVKYLRREETLQ